MSSKYDIPSPAIVVDLDIAQRNLQRVAAAVKGANLQFRPHQKTHKTAYFAKKAIEAGAAGLCVAKLAEAEIMAQQGLDNILIAYPLWGKEKWLRLATLHGKIKVVTTVDSFEIAAGISETNHRVNPGNPIEIIIEVDCGTLRCGISFEHLQPLAQKIRDQLPGVRIVGAFAYNGLGYTCTSIEQLQEMATKERQLLLDCKAVLEALNLEARILSGGNSPDTLVLDKLTGITEVRPGNCMFNDVSAINTGIATEADCAMRIIATVVSIPRPGNATCDAGSKTMTSDGATRWDGYGKVVGLEDVKIVKLNEEHGYMTYDPAKTQLKVGDRIEIIPNHCCVIPNLCDQIYGVRGDKVEEVIPIIARGMNY